MARKMSLFKKRTSRNVRQVRINDDEVEELFEEKSEVGSSYDADLQNENFSNGTMKSLENVTTKKSKKRKKEKSEKKTTGLSFGDDLEADDGIVFQERKSSLSYKLRKEMKREKKEKEKDGKQKTSDRIQNVSSISDFTDLGIKIVNGREAAAIAAQPGDSDEDEPGHHLFQPRKKQTQPSMRPWDNVIKKGEIPDANIIHQIRKQRQKAREDFIPLDDTVRVEESKSRLIREDENDHSEDEEARIGFSINQDEADRKLRREAFDAVQGDGQDSEPDADWELQQLKKAGAAAKISTEMGNISDQLDDANGFGVNPTVYSASVDPTYGSQNSMIPLSASNLRPPSNYQVEGILKRFSDSLEGCAEIYRRHTQESDRIVDELVACKAVTFHCQGNTTPFNDKFQFYQDMRGYVTDLRECLNEKLGDISNLENQIGLLAQQRQEKLMQRRRQDVKDQNNELSPFASQKAKEDEYRKRRAAEREGRRTRRRREREKKCSDSHRDGISTDDEESYSDLQTRQSEIGTLKEESNKILDDVEDEFAILKKVMGYFEDWKLMDSSSYVDAYVTYNLPKIFAPFIRLDLAFWNPLCSDDTMEVERMPWFSTCLSYNLADCHGENVEELKQNCDGKLMSHLIERIVLPKVTQLVTTSWDPLSHVQSVRLVNLVGNYVKMYPTITPKSKQLKALVMAIIKKIKDAVTNDVFIPIFPKSVYESKTSGVSLFFQRQFWSAWKLLGSVLMWNNILSDVNVRELAVRSLLDLYLVPALNLAAEINVNDALDKTKDVISVLPREWCKSDSETHVFLGRLEMFLVEMSAKMDPSTNEAEIVAICQLLKALGAKTQAEKVSNKYL